MLIFTDMSPNPGLSPGVGRAGGCRLTDPGRQPGAPGAPIPALIALLLAALSVPAWVPASAQAVPRADQPPAGALRITFDPTITFWDQQFRNGSRQSLGAFLSGDS